MRLFGTCVHSAPEEGGTVASTGTSTPAAQTPPPQTPTAPPAVEKDPEKEHAWLKGRLEQASKSGASSLLKSLGFANEAEAKAAIEAGKKAQESALSEQERIAKRLGEIEPLATRAGTLETALRGYAERELGALNEAQKTAVTAVAGDDPSRVLQVIEQLKPTWGTSQVPATPVPATTSPPPAAPPGTSAGSPPDHKAVHQRLLETNPIAAARYAEANPSVFS